MLLSALLHRRDGRCAVPRSASSFSRVMWTRRKRSESGRLFVAETQTQPTHPVPSAHRAGRPSPSLCMPSGPFQPPHFTVLAAPRPCRKRQQQQRSVRSQSSTLGGARSRQRWAYCTPPPTRRRR